MSTIEHESTAGCRPRRPLRVLITTAPLRGHLFPMVPLAWALRAAGHEVLVASTTTFVPTILTTGLPAVGWGTEADFVDLVVAERRLGDGDTTQRRRLHGEAFARIAANCIGGAERIVADWGPDLVISERAELAGPLAASRAGTPHVAFHWGVASLPEYREAAESRFAAAFAQLDPVLTLNPWPPSLRQPFAARHLGLRAVAFNGAAQLPEWLLRSRPRPRICVTFGTLMPHLAEAMVRTVVAPALARLTAAGNEVCLAVDDHFVDRWPELRAATAYAGHMPLAQLLPASDLLVNHGGQGTCLTALAAGLPQVVLPYMDDQFDNAAAVVRSRAGTSIALDELTPAVLSEHCGALLDDDTVARRARTVADEIATQPRLADVVDRLVELVAA